MRKYSRLFAVLLAVFLTLGMASMGMAQNKVRIVASGQPDHAAYLTQMIIDNGWDKEFGIEMELVYFDSGMAQIEALPAGQWEIGTMTAVPWLVGSIRYGLYAIAAANDDTTSNLVLVRPDSPILSVKGANPSYPETYGSAELIRGKTILTTTVSSAHYALSTWLSRFGLTDNDVVIKNMDQAQALAAFEAGIGDAVVLWAPTIFVGLDKGWKCANADSQLGANTPSILAASKEWADKHPDQVVAVLKAYFKAIDAMKKENVALAKPFSTWLLDWAGIEMSADYAATDIRNHTVWSLQEQLAMFDDSKGDSEVEKWVTLLGNFFVQQGRFSAKEMNVDILRDCVTDKFLQQLASQ